MSYEGTGSFQADKVCPEACAGEEGPGCLYKLPVQANWKTPHDLRAKYRSADFVSGNRAIFNIKGNHYRLLAVVDYENGAVDIQGIYTHAEYDKQTFS